MSVCWSYGKWCISIVRCSVSPVDHSVVKVFSLTLTYKSTPSFVEMFSCFKSRCIHWNLPYISPSSCRTASTDLPDPLSLPISIVHCPRHVFQPISCIGTELLCIGSSWSSCFCSSMGSGPQEYVAYELVVTSPAVFCMSGSSNMDSFRDGW